MLITLRGQEFHIDELDGQPVVTVRRSPHLCHLAPPAVSRAILAGLRVPAVADDPSGLHAPKQPQTGGVRVEHTRMTLCLVPLDAGNCR